MTQANLSGILLLDKPQGLTSNQALQRAKRLLSIKKAGHTGSLDPMATGMLPLCFNEGTKFSRFILEEKKCYIATLQLGAKTDTGDKLGQTIEEQAIPTITPEQCEAAQQRFMGEQSQIPPMYSALKFQGQCLYQLARKGQTIDRPARQIRIEELSITLGQQPGEIHFRCVCSKGTYIRTLAEDIAVFWGTIGHLSALRRLWVNPFPETDLVTLDALEAMSLPERLAQLHTLEGLLPRVLPQLQLSDEAVWRLQRGQLITLSGAVQEGWQALFDTQSRLIGVGTVDALGVLTPKRLMQNESRAEATPVF